MTPLWRATFTSFCCLGKLKAVTLYNLQNYNVSKIKAAKVTPSVVSHFRFNAILSIFKEAGQCLSNNSPPFLNFWINNVSWISVCTLMSSQDLKCEVSCFSNPIWILEEIHVHLLCSNRNSLSNSRWLQAYFRLVFLSENWT